MSAERSFLTPEQVAKAEQRIGYSHPVLTVIEDHLPLLTQLELERELLPDSTSQNEFIRQHYGFLVDAFVEAGPFEFTSLDIISIWSRAREVFGQYTRYRLAGAISLVYAMQDQEDPAWKRFPRMFFETHEISDNFRDKERLQQVVQRLSEVGKHITEIERYSEQGETQKPIDEQLMSKLEALIKSGNMDQIPSILDQFHQENTVTNEIVENFGNGFGAVYFNLKNLVQEM